MQNPEVSRRVLSFFPGVVPRSLILFVHLRSFSLVLRSRGCGEVGQVLGQREGSGDRAGGARPREPAPGWYLFPVYWFPGGEQALLPELEGGRPGVLAASQPQAWPPGTAETPPPSPLNKHPVLSQDGALGVKEQMWKGRGRSTGRDPFPPQNPTDCILVSCVTEVSLLAPHCPPHSP